MPPMARTNRNAPVQSVNALDDLDLDDMFEGGDDGLFAGLIDINDIGDITGDTISSPQKKKTNKSDPNNNSGTFLDSVDLDLFGDIGVDDGVTDTPQGETITSAAKSRRTTKRKIKTPSLGDDEDEFEIQPKKRRKGAMVTAKNAKAKMKKSKNVVHPVVVPEEVQGLAPAKISKKKTKAGAPAFSKSTSDGVANVAAAGRFGSQHKRAPFPQLPRATSKSKPSPGQSSFEAQGGAKVTKGKKATTVVPTPSEVVPLIPPPKIPFRRLTSKSEPSTRVDMKLMDTFCGLKPSDTLFYPFMPQMPSENSMKKCHKQYPIIDKIHSSLVNLNETVTNGIIDTANEGDAIFKLLTKELESHSLPTMGLGAAIEISRKSILATEKQQLTDDCKGLAVLLKRQHDFLYTSLQNMERWIKISFSSSDYAHVYGPEASNNALVQSPVSKRFKANSILRTFSMPIVRIKIKCDGFREPKMATPLLAQLYAVAPIPSAVVKTETMRTPKRKKVVAETQNQAFPPTLDLKITNYALMTPSQRRVRIQEALTRRAHQLEAKYLETSENRRKSLDRRQASLQKVVDDDDLLIMNTMTLWKWTDKALYFADITADDVEDILQHARQPERDVKDILVEESSIRKFNKGSTQSTLSSTKDHELEGYSGFFAGSLFDRLSSLLVDEGSANEDESDDSSFEDWDDETEKGDDSAFDFSNFSLDERTFIHLRAAGLIDESCPPPSANPALIEDDLQDEEADEFDSLIAIIKADLLKLQKINNSRASNFETTATGLIGENSETKLREELNNTLIAKYNQLIKRQKENKKSARQRTPKRPDEEWMPW